MVPLDDSATPAPTPALPPQPADDGLSVDERLRGKIPTLSIIIPALNERASLPRILMRVLDVELPCKRQIIIVDDGSTDGTLDAVAELIAAHADVIALRLPQTSGKGSAIRAALPHVRGDYVVIQDADEEYDPRDLPCLVRPLIDGRVRAVYGSRVINEHVRRQRRYTNPFWYGGRALTLLANLLYPVCRISDEPVGYKLVRMNLLRTIPLRCKGFEFCPELTAKLSRRGARIFNVAINYSPRSLAAGKKIRPKHFFQAVWTLIKYRFVSDHGKEDQPVEDAWAEACGAEVVAGGATHEALGSGEVTDDQGADAKGAVA